MFSLLVFIITLFLIILLFIMKGFEIYHGRKIFLERQFENFDAWIAKLLLKLKFWWSHVSFKNTKLVIAWIIVSARRFIISVKRRYDHEQSHFFTKRNLDISKHKSPPSFFLKDVSDYKKSLREGNEEKK